MSIKNITMKELIKKAGKDAKIVVIPRPYPFTHALTRQMFEADIVIDADGMIVKNRIDGKFLHVKDAHGVR